jgi:acetylornithine/succinyldiaminopimelate/putrescine aminotransferase
MPERPAPLIIARGENDLLFDEAGRSYIDLFSANGSAWLGHAHPRVAAAIARQLGAIWNTGALATPVRKAAQMAVERLFPDSHALAGFYSTGMEAAEFALRMARIATGRPRLMAFEHAMHGKSLAAAALGWDNAWNLRTNELVRLPFVDAIAESEWLRRIETELRSRDVAAVLVEPMLGSHGGYAASDDGYRALAELCKTYGTLLVFDEILTGFWRTGVPFWHAGLGFTPDVVLIGKALGGGFPVAGVVAQRKLAIEPRTLPGSTFAGNPLATAAVVATLEEMAALDLAALTRQIGVTIENTLTPLSEHGCTLRGRGAMWVWELPPRVDVARFLTDVYAQGVAVGNAGRFVRLLPAATISPERLRTACAVLADAVRRQLSPVGNEELA